METAASQFTLENCVVFSPKRLRKCIEKQVGSTIERCYKIYTRTASKWKQELWPLWTQIFKSLSQFLCRININLPVVTHSRTICTLYSEAQSHLFSWPAVRMGLRCYCHSWNMLWYSAKIFSIMLHIVSFTTHLTISHVDTFL